MTSADVSITVVQTESRDFTFEAKGFAAEEHVTPNKSRLELPSSRFTRALSKKC